MEPGSFVVFRGGMFHGAAQNDSPATRAALVLTYSLGWLRQEENQYLANPADAVRAMPPELQALIGFVQVRVRRVVSG
jgi:ectoine hydroxylase-related dioxygenase (phytanoyl-CoA dioxygenase family)